MKTPDIAGLDPRIKFVRKHPAGYEVMFPVLYRWNGDPPAIVDPPVVPPKGWAFEGLGVNLQLNCNPPLATKLMTQETT